jgi:hypothetical protein
MLYFIRTGSYIAVFIVLKLLRSVTRLKVGFMNVTRISMGELRPLSDIQARPKGSSKNTKAMQISAAAAIILFIGSPF